MKTKLETEVLNNMSKDAGNWYGPFYFNRKDPRLSVPKISPGLGNTLNFASPYAYLFMAGIALIIVAFKFFL
ncbi:hypothetical protein [Labilibacter marinus]|uniref:hypothetical protein n=1 Tax=Labilibacter marinus TaxID=1477105 RepID=UPI00083429DE|nr:hypothetical protein [Labilibacter marinus]